MESLTTNAKTEEQVFQWLISVGVPEEEARFYAKHPEMEYDVIGTAGWTPEERRSIGLDQTWEETLAVFEAARRRPTNGAGIQ